MGIFHLPSAADVAAHFISSLAASKRNEEPYTHWVLANALP